VNDLYLKRKERSLSAHLGTHPSSLSSKDHNLKYENRRYTTVCSDWNYNDPENFHKFRYSQKQKSKRPSSVTKNRVFMKEINNNSISPPEFKNKNKQKSLTSKNLFLYNVISKSQLKYQNYFGNLDSQNELSKNRIYEKRKSSNQWKNRKRSSSKGGIKESPTTKSSGKYFNKNKYKRSKSNPNNKKSEQRFLAKSKDKYLSKARSSTAIGYSSKSSLPHTASLRLNNILKDMGTHFGVTSSSPFSSNFSEELKAVKTNSFQNFKKFIDLDKEESKISNNLKVANKI